MILKQNLTFYFLPSHHATAIYCNYNNVVSSMYIENNLFTKNIELLIDNLLQQNNATIDTISKIVCFCGPCPLITMRTVKSFCLGLCRVLGIHLLEIEGIQYYRSSEKRDEEIIFINIFNKQCIVLDGEKNFILNHSEIKNYIQHSTIKKIVVSKNIDYDNFEDESKTFVSVLWPNIDTIMNSV
jgi:hypothetical protein